MSRIWRWLFARPYGCNGRNFRTEAALSRYVWKQALHE